MNLLSPWSLVWLAAAGAILALYLLKPRSRRVEVSSTWLWHGALREESARSLIQWLRRHLLLLLQLLVALLGIFALARPALTREVPVGHTRVLAMDVSAAMLARDGDPAIVAAARGGARPPVATRLDEARARALALLGQFRPGDRVVVLRIADRAQVVAQGTIPGDLDAIRSAIERLQVLPAELDFVNSLEVAGALTRSARLGEIIFFTGGVGDIDEATLAHRPAAAIQVVPVGKGDADNQAVTHLAARRSPGGDVEVFTRVTNFGPQRATGQVRVFVDGQLFQETPVELPPRQSQELLLTEFPPNVSVVEARFDRQDLLAIDNVATAAVTVAPLRKVALVGGRSDHLERALRAVPGVHLERLEPPQYDPKGGFDVYVFEGWFPAQPPPGHWVMIDPPAKGAPVGVTGTLGRETRGGREVNTAQIARVLPNPLLRGVDLAGVGIRDAKKVRLPEWAEEVVAAREAPLIFMGYPRPYRAVVFAFDLRSSNLFGRVGFPILIANVINWLTGEPMDGDALIHAGDRFAPGDALSIQPLPRATRVQIETPAQRRYRFDGNQPVRFVDTALPGAYSVTQYAGNEEIVRRVYIAGVLPIGRESSLADLKPRDAVPNLSTIGGAQPLTVVLGPGKEQSHAEWWRLLGVAALAGLLLEWWWFQR
ncbi:MAG: VWA domain-containing protein [Chloroflexi bacterium]|nr:VWA domain-containing protein [Chloroflexota bacterium]